jgi:hypothetical protein
MATPATSHPLPELTPAYHQARHLLGFLSALLLMWDYLGLGFVPADEGLFGLKVMIGHTAVIANVILVLGFYGALRLGVEWWQCDQGRRDTTASIVDCAVAYLLFVAAETYYVLLRLHVEIKPLTGLGVILGLLFAPLFILFVWLAQPKTKRQRALEAPTTRLLWTILSASGIAVITLTAIGILVAVPGSVLLGLPIGAVLWALAAFFYTRIAKKLSSLPAA